MSDEKAMQAAILELLQRVQRLEAEAADRRSAREVDAYAIANSRPHGAPTPEEWRG